MKVIIYWQIEMHNQFYFTVIKQNIALFRNIFLCNSLKSCNQRDNTSVRLFIIFTNFFIQSSL